MRAIPFFNSDFEALHYARQHKPFRKSLEALNSADYERRYGRELANCADACRVAAQAGDLSTLAHLTSRMSRLAYLRECKTRAQNERRAA